MTNKNIPMVSVVIPTYNRSLQLKRAIESVIGQNYDNLEILVVDDASTDDTRRIVESFDDRRIYYLRHETNQHLSASRNTGIEHANGEYVAFLDDDDVWLPNKIPKQVDCLRSTPPKTKLVYCWMYVFDGESIVNEIRPELSGDIFLNTLPNQPITNGSTFLVEESAFETLGMFDESLRRGIDGDFLRRYAREFYVDYVPEILARYSTDDHHRITRADTNGIRNAIEGHKIKYRKFGEVLREHPKIAAEIDVNIACRYAQIGDLQSAIKYYTRALTKAPFEPRVYRIIGSMIVSSIIS